MLMTNHLLIFDVILCIHRKGHTAVKNQNVIVLNVIVIANVIANCMV